MPKKFLAITEGNLEDRCTCDETVEEAVARAKQMLSNNHLCGEVYVMAPIRVVKAKESPMVVETVAAE